MAVEREEWKFDTLCDLYDTLTITQANRPPPPPRGGGGPPPRFSLPPCAVEMRRGAGRNRRESAVRPGAGRARRRACAPPRARHGRQGVGLFAGGWVGAIGCDLLQDKDARVRAAAARALPGGRCRPGPGPLGKGPYPDRCLDGSLSLFPALTLPPALSLSLSLPAFLALARSLSPPSPPLPYLALASFCSPSSVLTATVRVRRRRRGGLPVPE